MKKKPYVFRPYGQDEGSVALLTEAEEKRIQDRLDAIEEKTGGEPPYYIYEMDFDTAKGINEILDECERRIISDMLERTRGNQTEAAERFQVPLSTLNQKIKRLNIEVKRKRDNHH